MGKFSKKLVSKCIYIQILKCSNTELLGQFMGVQGWPLIHTWLTEGIGTQNWPLVQEILELLLLCPVDVQRLKSNTNPKLVKGLSRDGGNEGKIHSIQYTQMIYLFQIDSSLRCSFKTFQVFEYLRQNLLNNG